MMRRASTPLIVTPSSTASFSAGRILNRAAGVVLLLLIGCRGVPVLDKFAPGGSSAIAATGEKIVEHATDSMRLASDGGKQFPDVPQFGPIFAHQKDIIELGGMLHADAKALKSSEAECAKLREKAGQWERFAFSLFIVFGGIALAASPVVAYFAAPKLAMLIAVAGVSSIAVGVFLRDWSFTLGIAVGGLVIFGACVLGYTIWRRYASDRRTADSMARTLRDVENSAKPDVTAATFSDKFAAKLPALEKAMDRLESQPKGSV